MTSKSEKSNNTLWGKGVFLLYGSFVVFILIIVVYAFMQDFHLVEKDYYRKELAYQTRIDEIKNTNNLDKKPVWLVNQGEKTMTIEFPKDLIKDAFSGNILFYKPSEAGGDMNVKIAPDSSGIQVVNLGKLSRGLWKIKLNWKDNLQSYYLEDKFMLE